MFLKLTILFTGRKARAGMSVPVEQDVRRWTVNLVGKDFEMGYKCDACRYGIANGGADIDCPPCMDFSGFEPVDLAKKLREFIETEADALEESGFSADAERFREFLADLYPCA